MQAIGSAEKTVLVRVIEKPDLHILSSKAVQQPRAHSHFTEILAKRRPVRCAAAPWTMVNANHLVAPDIGLRLSGNRHVIRMVIGDQPAKLPAKGAVAACDPFGPRGHL